MADGGGMAVTCPKTTLAPGESMTCTGSGTATFGQHSNVGAATGTPSGGSPVTAQDASHYLGYLLGNQGCTPAYWKNHTGSWPPTGYTPNQTVVSVFTESSRFPAQASATLLEALGFDGDITVAGAAEILLRAGVAGLLNASHPGVAHPRTPAAVSSDINTALASESRDTMLMLAAALNADNNRGCPLY